MDFLMPEEPKLTRVLRVHLTGMDNMYTDEELEFHRETVELPRRRGRKELSFRDPLYRCRYTGLGDGKSTWDRVVRESRGRELGRAESIYRDLVRICCNLLPPSAGDHQSLYVAESFLRLSRDTQVSEEKKRKELEEYLGVECEEERYREAMRAAELFRHWIAEAPRGEGNARPKKKGQIWKKVAATEERSGLKEFRENQLGGTEILSHRIPLFWRESEFPMGKLFTKTGIGDLLAFEEKEPYSEEKEPWILLLDELESRVPKQVDGDRQTDSRVCSSDRRPKAGSSERSSRVKFGLADLEKLVKDYCRQNDSMGASSREVIDQIMSLVASHDQTSQTLRESLFDFLGPKGIDLVDSTVRNRSKLLLEEATRLGSLLGSAGRVHQYKESAVVVHNKGEESAMRRLESRVQKLRSLAAKCQVWEAEQTSESGDAVDSAEFCYKNIDVIDEKVVLDGLFSNFPLCLQKQKLVQIIWPHGHVISRPISSISVESTGEKKNKSVPASNLPGLPKYLQFRSERRCDIIHMPLSSVPPRPAKDEASRLLVSEVLPPLFRPVFASHERLNIVQSRVFDIAYHSNANMLVCAPTGTGKTNVALLAMLREIRQLVPDQDCLNSESPSVSFDPSEFKLVYLAPMKALATEIATSFAERLSSLRLIVREFTGDSQLSQREISKVHVLVMTPEKYDILTRKASEHSHALLVRLLVIDEVHLLHEERGCVLESIVARTLRQVELTQKMVRIVALSATLANYPDVATFLRVPRRACFHFGPEYRPVPMSQTFIGVKSRSSAEEKEIMNEICYQRAVESLKFGHQVMIFVQSRNDTVQTAYAILDMFASHSASNDNNPLDPQQQPASSHATSHLLDLQDSHPSFTRLRRALASSKFPCLSALFSRGVLFHHAGMPPADRHLVERAFLSGCVRLLVCTTTLAWGVNLPVHTVIIKGTQVYKPEKGAPDDLDTIDVLQIFGRAGRPQFDTSAEGILITSHSKLHNYVRLVCRLQPVESRLISRLADHLNAEVVLGTISNLQDAIQWLTYTYLAVRVAKNPLAYGVPWVQLIEDPSFLKARQEFVLHAAKTLDRCQMVRFDPITQQIHPTEFGRIASHYYIEHETMDLFRQALQASSSPDPSISLDPSVAPGDLKTSALPLKDNFIQHYKATPSSLEKLLNLVSFSSEFKNIRVRDQEIDELEEIYAHCPLSPFGGVAHSSSKVNLLIQVHICRIFVRSPSLHSDLAYISQSANRILRGLFEVALKSHIAQKSVDILVDALNLCKSFEQQVWITRHPLAQLANLIPASSLSVLEGKRYPISALREDSLSLISNLLLAQKPVSLRVQKAARTFPLMNLDAKLQPLTRTVFRLIVNFSVDFHWDKSVHGAVFHAWLLVHDICETTLYHQQLLSVHEQQRHHLPPITCTILLEDAIKLEQLVVRILSDRWLHSEAHMCINLSNLKLPDEHCPYTPLLPCEPLPLRALCRPKPWPVAQLYPSLSYLNPLQTQCFFVAYHTNRNLLVGAPTGSGKTLVAELATLRLFREAPHLKVVYIAPLKALVRERLVDWTNKFARILQPAKRVVELTGDYTPDSQALTLADVVVTTPEKWDGISRRWRQRPYVQKVGLLIIDEIHLLGEERGAVLEAIVSRTRFVSTLTNTPIRFLALSTAISNAYDLTSWLDIDPLLGLYNFKPSIRPVPCQVHLAGFPGRHYCPRMASMNRPTFKAIETYSPTKPALIFVSSRRQTRLTALDLISLCAQSDQPQRFLHLDDHALRQSVQAVQDEHLKHTLSYGIGLHHAGLTDDDKSLVEQLFRSGAIQVLVSTATLAWGINLPAHLVVIKGTEYFDAKTHSYIDYPVTDILQMIGRAGRPQFDTHGCAVVLVEASKKPFYAKFLYEAFPVESQLRSALHDHLNAEIVAGTVRTKQDAVEYLTWTFWFRRLLKNPNYYGLSDTSPDSLNRYLSDVVHQVCDELQRSRCISCSHTPTSDDSLSDDLNSFPPLPSSNLAKEDLLFDSPSCQHSLWPLFLGQIASHYYLSHSTVHLFSLRLTSNLSIRSILCLACCAKEYDELPVRHNEDVVIASNMLRRSRFRLSPSDFDSNLSSFHSDPHLKACLLVQFHLSRLPLPITDFITDTKQVFDQFTRILQAMIDVSAHSGWLLTTLKCMYILQMCVQACWLDQPPLSLLPGFLSPPIQQLLLKHHIRSPAQLLHAKHIVQTIKQHLSASDSNSLDAALGSWPVIHLRWSSSSLSPSPPLRYQLIVQIHRSHPKHPCHVYAPHFPKKKEDGWWLALSSSDKTQLLALKKITHINASPTCSRRRVYLDFETPQPVNLVHLLLISDTYVGLDQEYAVQLDAPSSQEASRHHSTCPTSTD